MTISCVRCAQTLFCLRSGQEKSSAQKTRTRVIWFTPGGAPDEYLSVNAALGYDNRHTGRTRKLDYDRLPGISATGHASQYVSQLQHSARRIIARGSTQRVQIASARGQIQHRLLPGVR